MMMLEADGDNDMMTTTTTTATTSITSGTHHISLSSSSSSYDDDDHNRIDDIDDDDNDDGTITTMTPLIKSIIDFSYDTFDHILEVSYDFLLLSSTKLEEVDDNEKENYHNHDDRTLIHHNHDKMKMNHNNINNNDADNIRRISIIQQYDISNGMTPFHYSCYYQRFYCMDVLCHIMMNHNIKKNKYPHLSLNDNDYFHQLWSTTDHYGRTPFHYLCLLGYESLSLPSSTTSCHCCCSEEVNNNILDESNNDDNNNDYDTTISSAVNDNDNNNPQEMEQQRQQEQLEIVEERKSLMEHVQIIISYYYDEYHNQNDDNHSCTSSSNTISVLNQQDYNGQTPLHLILQQLMSSIVSHNIKCHYNDKMWYEYYDIIELLLNQYHVKFDILNHDHITSYHLAKQTQQQLILLQQQQQPNHNNIDPHNNNNISIHNHDNVNNTNGHYDIQIMISSKIIHMMDMIQLKKLNDVYLYIMNYQYRIINS